MTIGVPWAKAAESGIEHAMTAAINLREIIAIVSSTLEADAAAAAIFRFRRLTGRYVVRHIITMINTNADARKR
jgi:hypothetical protein